MASFVHITKEEKKQSGSQMIVAVAGCVAQAEGEEIFRRSNVVDIIVGPESYQTLPDLVGKVIRDKKKKVCEFEPSASWVMSEERDGRKKKLFRREDLLFFKSRLDPSQKFP